MSIEALIESQVQDALAAGAFDNLPGAGKPLPPPEAERLAGTNWLGFKVAQNGGMLPGWLGPPVTASGQASRSSSAFSACVTAPQTREHPDRRFRFPSKADRC